MGDVVEGVLRLGWSDGDGDIGVNTGLRVKGMGYYGAKGTWGYGSGESTRDIAFIADGARVRGYYR